MLSFGHHEKHIFQTAICCVFLTPLLLAQTKKLSDWTQLIDKAKCTEARTLCTPYADSAVLAEKVDAQKCLANVALCANDTIILEGADNGGGSIHGGFKPEAVDEALRHLEIGLQLAPQDLTIHMGRLHILEEAGRYEQMVKALGESCTLYQGKEAPKAWLAYAPELADLGQLRAGVEFMKVLDKHYPNNSDIISNIGAFLSMQKKFDEAIPYLQKSVALAPNDPMNAWDLGHVYEHTDQIALADKWYTVALALPPSPDLDPETKCLYAVFIEKKLKDRARACTLEKTSCPADKQTACKPAAPTPAPAK